MSTDAQPAALEATAWPPCPWWDEPHCPIRGDLCSGEQLEDLARAAAAAARAGPRPANRALLRRLRENDRALARAHKQLTAAGRAGEPLTPDAEWLLDNYYVIADVLREVRTDLPRGYFVELPALADGEFAGLPRVYALALVLLAHSDSSLEENAILRFVRAFQNTRPLTIGELWAVPTMLRVALLENLRRLAEQCGRARADRATAEAWAKGMDPAHPLSGLPQEPSDAYAVGLLHALRDHPASAELLGPLSEWAGRHGLTPADALRREHRRQAADQVSIGNCVTSLRLVNALDWAAFFERASLVESDLRAEPSGVYLRQDFATRDSYRRAVERLARGARRPEREVARRAVEKSEAAAPDPRRGHVGFWLVGPGRPEFAAELGYRPRWRDRWREALTDHPDAAFFGSLTAVTAALLAAVVLLAEPAGWGWALAAAAAALLPVSELAVGLVNALVCRLLLPRVLPKLDFKDGLPPDCPTFVVIPCLLSSPASARPLLERLELHYLANPDPRLRFALLTDFSDAHEEHRPEDESIVQSALESVRALNRRHAPGGEPLFFLFHRRRLWNPSEGRWMGWERKRGKLAEFNRLLRGARDTSYAVTSVDVDEVPQTRYVLTLDADTHLPRDTAPRLVGTLAHPLNRAVLSADGRRVVEGYGLLQPRVSFLYKTGFRSLFARVYAGSAGVDPYSSAASDAYMDLFARGTFTGKGLYDVDAFEATTGPAFPENHILSHDLIEGNFARCGLASDVEVFDDFPAKFHAYARREHRWARGDWQLLPWLGHTVPVSAERGARNTEREDNSSALRAPRSALLPNVLPLLERWKVFDNLRRSLVAPALVVMLVLGWTVLPGSPWLWTLLAIAVPFLPLALLAVITAASVLRGAPPRTAWQAARLALGNTFWQVVLAVVFLAFQAANALDAVLRTLWRLFIARRRLLEWETAAATEARLGDGWGHFLRAMWQAPALAAALAALVAWASPAALAAAGPLLALWLLSPFVACIVSAPLPHREPVLSAAERAEMRRAARKTWRFFEAHVGDADHWLPPDNFQEEPGPKVAHRTSPTNVGLLLVSTLAAHDLGYLGLPGLAGRLAKTFRTLAGTERYRGHFLNWYDTRTLRTLPPAYVSTVDSGNLLACLLTLKQGLLEKLKEPVPSPAAAAGLADALALFAEELNRARPAGADARLPAEAAALADRLKVVPDDLSAWDDWLTEIEKHAADWPERAAGFGPEAVHWAAALLAEASARREELLAVCPWAPLLRAENGRPVVAELGRPAGLAHWEDRLPELRAALPAGPLAEALAASAAGKLAGQIRDLAERAEVLAADMDFGFLYNPARHLFAIGYHVPLERLDRAHYDLLASEACLTSLLMVALDQAPKRHWFQLGRPAIRAAGRPGLLSWGGTIFEYLTPRLFLPAAAGTYLDVAQLTAVLRQQEYGRQTGLPWGVSESGYNRTDADGNYQYQAFGIPGLGLKRGLSRDLVVAPYATLMAVMVEPHAALANLRRLAQEGGEGPLGFYEAIDYTPDRLAKGEKKHVIRSYMAHHQGMALTALTNRLLGDVMPRRLTAEPAVRAVELLLQERVPLAPPQVRPHIDEESGPPPEADPAAVNRRLTTPHTPAPRTHLLSNGRYTVMLTNAGGGFSTCNGLDVTRWRPDRTADSWGQFVYVRDREANQFWSIGHQPVGRPADFYEVTYSIDKAEVRRRDGRIDSVMEVTVSPESDAEVRRVTLTNHDTRPRELELTSYAEVVLATRAADLAHPAFGKLFLETEWLPAVAALVCRRRPRAAEQKPVWAVHVLAADARLAAPIEYETDRGRFLGRRRTPAHPEVMDAGALHLSGTVGPVLDPVFSLRCRLWLEPGTSATVAFSTGAAAERDAALALAAQFHSPGAVARAFDLAWAHSRVALQHMNVSARQAHLYQRVAGHVLLPGRSLRAPAGVLMANRQGQPGLWRHGLSGDLSIVVARFNHGQDLGLLAELLTAHSYWRDQGLAVDLVVLNESPTSYYEDLNQAALALVRASDDHDMLDRPGGVFLRKSDHFSDEDRTLLLACARLVLSGDQGALSDQIVVAERGGLLPVRPAARPRPWPRPAPVEMPPGLLFANGFGGFTADGREYVIAPGAVPPAPWCNVVANPHAGCLVTDSGLGYTWAGNSQTNRLTPWSNDPVSDPPGEAVYLHDEDTGETWTPTPLPAGGPTTVRHGQGATTFEQRRGDLAQELTVFVPPEEPVKLVRLRVRNHGGRLRRLAVTYYADWVLGTVRDQTALHVVTEVDSETGALTARNAFNMDFPAAVAFADVDRRPRTLTADRAEFLGRNGRADAPGGLARAGLSGRVGPGLDPCAAVQTRIEVPPGEEAEVVFMLGQAADLAAVRPLVQKYRQPSQTEAARAAAVARWDELLAAVQVQTPDAALNVLVNRWLPYQVLVCRVWGRSAFYQSGGAYGFRDQLQDVLALLHAAPGEARAHILRAAARQFVEGDVQHWWHPPAGRGVRTRCSDDFLWLAYVVGRYVELTGDDSILKEEVPYLEAPPLKEGQEEEYGLPSGHAQPGPLYEHCLRSLDHGWKRGAHGLPLMGIGDWNDGMNKVGAHGKGESVWVAWFQIVCLRRFADLADRRGDADHARVCRARAGELAAAAEEHAWDGGWYRRAYFDDGTPLGSAQNDECQIDSIAQSWAVLSSAADPDRAAQAVDAAVERLVKWDERVVLLFDPPFDAGKLQPGYIKGYVPGIRENGGQYTHAAIWLVQAVADLGRGGAAYRLFDLIDPVRHADTPEKVARYKVEPYVVAADVYGRPPHTGRGGWTWYTGSASWLYQLAVESLLGLHRRGDRLTVAPRVPKEWDGFEIRYRYGTAHYRIRVENPHGAESGVSEVQLDGQPVEGAVPLADDGREHAVRIVMGSDVALSGGG